MPTKFGFARSPSSNCSITEAARCAGFFLSDSSAGQLFMKRSRSAERYRRLYHTKQWRQLRGTILTRDGFRCQRCGVTLTNGRSDPRSTVVHHREPHRGDETLFFDASNLEAVCWQCHSGAIQSQEALGYDTTIGSDGWPVDARHPMIKI